MPRDQEFFGLPETITDLVDEASTAFDIQCSARHKMGAEKYGPVKFLESNTNLYDELKHELVDAANYARYLFIRLTVLEQMVAGRNVSADTPRGPQGIVNHIKAGDK